MSYLVEKVIADGFEMQYIKFGSGEKTLVIIPGLSIQSVVSSAALIEKQYEIFSKDFTVYLFDRRENLPEIYSVCDMAKDTAKAIKKLKLEKICLFGISQGGMISMLIAAENEGLVSKLVLASTACKANADNSKVISEWIELAEQGKTKELCLSFGENVYPKDFYEKYKSAFKLLAKTVSESDLKRFIILSKGCDGFDATKDIKNIRCSVLVIGDTEDKVLGAESLYEIEKHMKSNTDFELYMYSGYAHAVYDLAPDYTQRLYNFFTG